MIVFLGPAGAGKSTQGEMLASRFGWHWLSSGQLLRDAHDAQLTKIMNEGQLVPSEKVDELIVEAIKSSPDSKKIILDGFTRKIEEARFLVESQSQHNGSIDLVIVFDMPKDDIENRLKLRDRVDDTPQAIEERLSLYYEQLDQIQNYFSSNGIKIAHIDGSGTIEQIHQRILKELQICNLN